MGSARSRQRPMAKRGSDSDGEETYRTRSKDGGYIRTEAIVMVWDDSYGTVWYGIIIDLTHPTVYQ